MGTIGRFTVQHKLGQGGMGVVYQVHDPQSDGVFALKVLRTVDDMGPLEEARFTREFALLSRLSHPNLIRVYESGLHEGASFFTMELLAGECLGAWSVRLPLPGPSLWGERNAEVFGVLFSLLDAIEYMHRLGIIHRDIQPNNVMIAADGQTRLMDFGLARDISSGSALTQSGTIMGTLRYCSPEQLNDTSAVDTRADLYAFGVILYELVTGQPPFEGSLIELIARILNDPAPSPLRANPTLPPALSQLVLRLLDKDPSYRFQSAGKLRRALAAVAADVGVAVPSRPDDDGADLPADVVVPDRSLFEPRYFPPKGAGESLSRLVSELQAGSNSFLLVYGEEGVGKTRFARELVRLAEARGLRGIHTTCDAEGASPYHAVVPMLQAACRSLESEELEARFGQAAGLLLPFLKRQATHQLPADQSADKLRLFDVVSRVFRDAARERPAVLIVDDIQWADVDSFELLSYLVRDQAYQPSLGTPGLGVVWICARDAEPSLRERISRLTAGHSHGGLTLTALDRSQFDLLVGSMLGSEEGVADIAPFLYKETGGNPGFAFEALRGLVEGHALVQKEGVWVPSISWHAFKATLPVSLKDAYARRLRVLPQSALEVLPAAALLGVEFNYQDIRRTLEGPESAALTGLDQLLAHKIVRPVAGRRKGQFAFVSPQLRRYVVKDLSFPQRQRLHYRILKGLEAALSGGDRRVLHALASHAHSAGDVERALRYTLLAAEAAARAVANERAADLYQQAQPMPGFEKQLTHALRCQIFDVLMSAGRYAAACELASDSARLEGEPGRRAHWLHRVGRALMGLGRNDEALHHFTASLESVGYRTPMRGAALWGSVAWQFLCHLPHLGGAIRAGALGQDPPQVTEALEVMLAMPNLYYFVRMPQRDAFFFNNVLRAFNTAQHVHSLDIQVLVQASYAFMLVMTPHPPAALIRRFLQRARERIADMTRLDARIDACRFAGYAYHLLGDFKLAEELFATCVSISERGNNARGLAHGLVMQSLTYWDCGPVPALYRTAATGATKCDALGDPTFTYPGRLTEACALALQERYAEAQQVIARTWEGLDRDGLEVGAVLMRWAEAYVARVQRQDGSGARFEDVRRRWLSASMDHIQAYRIGLEAGQCYLHEWQIGVVSSLVESKIRRWVREARGVSHDIQWIYGQALVVEGQLELHAGRTHKGLALAQGGLDRLSDCGADLIAVDHRLGLAETLLYLGLEPRAEEHRLLALHQAESLGAAAYITAAKHSLAGVK